jgi:hypothetical protein
VTVTVKKAAMSCSDRARLPNQIAQQKMLR